MVKINYFLIPFCLLVSFFILSNSLSFTTYAQIFEFNAEGYYETETEQISTNSEDKSTNTNSEDTDNENCINN